jgi:hypothetical protein
MINETGQPNQAAQAHNSATARSSAWCSADRMIASTWAAVGGSTRSMFLIASLTGLDVKALDLAMEQFTAVFIRLASVEQMSFTTLGVLHTLAGSGPMRLSELTASERVTQPAMTQLVTRLERDGLAVRSPDPSDGRAVLVQVTPPCQGGRVAAKGTYRSPGRPARPAPPAGTRRVAARTP